MSDLPMIGRLTRESKRNCPKIYRDRTQSLGRYILSLKFARSHRYYGEEIIHAAGKRAALKLARKLYPSAMIS